MPKINLRINFKAVALGLLFFLLFLLILGLLPYFRLTHLDVIGLQTIDKEEIKHLLKEPINKPMLFLLTEPLQERLITHPWIEEAEVKFSFPNRINIVIKERKTLAYLPYYGNLLAVSEDGTALAVVKDLPKRELLFTGLELPFLAVGERIPQARLMGELSLIIEKMDDHYRDMVKEIQKKDEFFYLYTADLYKIRVDTQISQEDLNDLRTVVVFMRGRNIKGTVIMQGDKPVFLPD